MRERAGNISSETASKFVKNQGVDSLPLCHVPIALITQSIQRLKPLADALARVTFIAEASVENRGRRDSLGSLYDAISSTKFLGGTNRGTVRTKDLNSF